MSKVKSYPVVNKQIQLAKRLEAKQLADIGMSESIEVTLERVPTTGYCLTDGNGVRMHIAEFGFDYLEAARAERVTRFKGNRVAAEVMSDTIQDDGEHFWKIKVTPLKWWQRLFSREIGKGQQQALWRFVRPDEVVQSLCAGIMFVGFWAMVTLFVFGAVGCDTVTSLSASAQADVRTTGGFVSSAARLQKAAERAALHVEMVLEMELVNWAVKIGDPAEAARADGQGQGVAELQQRMDLLAYTQVTSNDALIIVDARVLESRWHSILVHELVHVAQVQRLGMSPIKKSQWHHRQAELRFGKGNLPFPVVRVFNVLIEAQAYQVGYEMDGIMTPLVLEDPTGLYWKVMGVVRRLGHERIFEILNSEQFVDDMLDVNFD
jgi:hypothetical protein